MSQHTPGPWKLGSQDKLWITNGKLSIATCEEQDMPEAQANARLIAAAPELLGTLRNIAAWLEHPRVSNVDGVESAANAVRYVIAKAEGSEP